MRIITGVLLLIISILFHIKPAEAAKKFVPKGKTAVSTGKSGGGVPAKVSYRADKKALNFHFTSFSGISSVSYVFSYDTNGITQGAAGSVSSANSPGQSRELLFGTCSTAVCTYHSGLKNAKLTFTANYSNGRKASKVFRIKTYF